MKKGIFAIITIVAMLMGGLKNNTDFLVTIETENKTYYIYREEMNYIFDQAFVVSLKDKVDKIVNECYVPFKNAKYLLDENGNIAVQKEKNGKIIDAQKLYEDIISALSVGGGVVKARYNLVYPDFKVEDLLNTPTLRARFSTGFYGSIKERIHNIKRATSSVNQMTIYPNTEFSFNKTVGVRNEENGYQNAKVIVDGQYVDGLGGGVCQVSTTLYNVALLADLKITEYHQHTLAVSYIEKSFDAMVSYGFADLKIQNNLKWPIFIVGKATDDTLTFEVYGEPQTKTIVRQSVVTKVITPTEQYLVTDNLKTGESKVVLAPKYGYESQGYLVITENGITTRTLLRQDQYKKVDGLTEVGR